MARLSVPGETSAAPSTRNVIVFASDESAPAKWKVLQSYFGALAMSWLSPAVHESDAVGQAWTLTVGGSVTEPAGVDGGCGGCGDICVTASSSVAVWSEGSEYSIAP